MGEFFTEIDALCSMLGWRDGDTYTIDPSAVQGLKQIIWFLKQDQPAHGCRLYLGNKRIVQTDLIPMVINYFDVPEVVDVLLRLLVNLTSPTLLLYNGNYPREPLEQRKFMLLNEISEAYKEAFSVQSFWSVLVYQLEKNLYTDWTLRSEQDGLTIERILVLTRNVLQVPTNVDHEKLLDNDASLHDRMVWVLHKTGILDLVLYILGSSEENRFVIHALEIVYIVFREQSARELANATLARTANEKMNDEAELTKLLKKGPGSGSRPTTSSRNTWFRGTYTYNNVKSVSDNDTICHQGLNNIVKDKIGAEKRRIKPNFRLAKEIEKLKRKSVLQVRLFLREYSLEILRIYNNLVRQVRRYLDQYGSNVSEFHDESYLLWAFRFFLEFNRNNDFKLDLVSESLSLDTFHWIITRMNIYNENIMLDKTRKSVWCRRLHLTVQTLHELLKNLQALDVHRDSKAALLKSVLQHNIFYVVEYREAATHLLTSFKETVHNRSYLKDVVQLAHIFFSMLQKFCKRTIRAQDRVKPQGKKAKKKQSQKQEKAANKANELEQLEGKWLQAAAVVSFLLENNLELRTENLPTPFDSTSSVPIEEQKGYSVKAIYAMLHGEKYEEAIKMLFAARSVWTTDKSFGSENETSDKLLMIFKDIFFAHLATDDEKEDSERESETNVSSEDEATEDLHARAQHEEKDFKFEDFSKKLVDKRVVRACTVVLENWAHLEPSHLKAAVTLLYRIAFEHKMPSMLFHMALLRVFRSVLCGPRSDDSKELARLAVYIIRQVQIKAGVIPDEEDDRVLLAEMLVYKTNRIAAAIDMGYDDLFGLSARKPVASRNVWTEEQEEELRCLFIENQNCPSNDEDVINWLLSNIIDQTRSRQAVIKKLKELGLIFRAPTKRSNANVAQQGNKRNTGDDELLDEEYNELQLEENASQDKFSLEAIAKRMLQLRLIANVAEILPTKSPYDPYESDTETSSDDSNDDDNRAPADDNILLDDDNFKEYLVMREFLSMSDELFYSLPWILENLLKMRKMHNDPEPLSDLTGGMAIVPIEFNDIESLKNTQFQRILNLFGMLPPSLEHVYYRVPYKLNTSALQSRIDVIIKFMKSKDESIEEEGPLGIYHSDDELSYHNYREENEDVDGEDNEDEDVDNESEDLDGNDDEEEDVYAEDNEDEDVDNEGEDLDGNDDEEEDVYAEDNEDEDVDNEGEDLDGNDDEEDVDGEDNEEEGSPTREDLYDEDDDKKTFIESHLAKRDIPPNLNTTFDEEATRKHLETLDKDLLDEVKWITDKMFKTIQLHNTNISPTGGEYIRPSTPRQYSAIKRPEFQRLLRLLTIYPPTVQCKFHRIPFALSPPMLRKRHTVLIRYIKANGYYPLEQSKAMQLGLDKQETKPLEETGGSSTKRNRWDSSDSELEPAVNQKKPRRKAIIISDEDEP